jgi:hypothetical protein
MLHTVDRSFSSKSLPKTDTNLLANLIVGIVTMVCGAAAPGCNVNYKINHRASCKLNPIWYMVLILEMNSDDLA